jgi:hypothetical protein
MVHIIIYISGIITTLSVVGFFYQLIKSGEKSLLIKSLNDRVSELSQKVSEKLSKKRLATLEWDSWYNSAKPNETWSVTFELREIALSEDETKSKFEVISVHSENMKDGWKDKEYTDFFMKKTGGGWLDTTDLNGLKLTWITTTSKAEAREEKISQILGNDD